MKTTYISALFLFILFVVCAPQTSSAYFTTNQSATKMTERTAFFTIEYAFGLQKHDIYMPVFATRNLAWKSTLRSVGYSIYSGNTQTETLGTTAGIVLSKAPIVDGMYKISKNTPQKMTLFVAVTMPQGVLGSNFKLHVDQLPYYVDAKDKGNTSELTTLQLNPSELQYYVTKEVTLNALTSQTVGK